MEGSIIGAMVIAAFVALIVVAIAACTAVAALLSIDERIRDMQGTLSDIAVQVEEIGVPKPS